MSELRGNAGDMVSATQSCGVSATQSGQGKMLHFSAASVKWSVPNSGKIPYHPSPQNHFFNIKIILVSCTIKTKHCVSSTVVTTTASGEGGLGSIPNCGLLLGWKAIGSPSYCALCNQTELGFDPYDCWKPNEN